MTLDQLRVFVAVAERQHMTRAAEALNLAQSAVSATIAGLEGRYGAKLFDRIGRGIELTKVGSVFLEEARGVLDRAEAAELKLAELSGLKRGRLLVHASQTIASYWLPRHLVTFGRAHPGIAIRLVVGNTAEVAAAILAGTAELGLVEGPIKQPLLSATEIARDQLVLVVGPNHPWTAKRCISTDDLAEAEWVLRESGSGTRSVLEAALRNKGVATTALKVVLELPTNEAVRGAVGAGMGATAISASAAASGLEAGLLHKVDFDLPVRAFHLLRHIHRQPSHAAQAMAQIVSGAADA
jgi:DNA-binding transcriptional LysR family regulator